jgi:hypothetical protein
MLLLILAPFSAAAQGGQEAKQGNTDLLFNYEEMKKDKATALAWSLILPGGGVFYAGSDNEFGAGMAAVETASLGMAVYVGNQVAIGNALPGDRGMVRFFSLVYLATKVIEVGHAFHLVNDYNENLLRTLDAGPRTTPVTILSTRKGGRTPAVLLRMGWEF